MLFSDIHIHLLYGVDDGVKTPEGMFALVDKLYSDGARLICATPHCFPEWYGDNRDSAKTAFDELVEYCQNKYSDLQLFLGNELYYEKNEDVWLDNGLCKPLGESRCVLMEFPIDASESEIVKGCEKLLSKGFLPVIAHAERYVKLTVKRIKELRQNQVMIQVNNRKDFKGFDFGEKKRLKNLLANGLVDFVSSDAHGLNGRKPYMKEFYEVISRKYGANYADEIFYTNAKRIFDGTLGD